MSTLSTQIKVGCQYGHPTPRKLDDIVHTTCRVTAAPTAVISMSSSSTTMASNPSEVPSKRRRTASITNANGMNQQVTQILAEGSAQQPVPASSSQPATHIPKRGARACTACRKGKNRCEGEVRLPCVVFVFPWLLLTGPMSRPGPASPCHISPPAVVAK